MATESALIAWTPSNWITIVLMVAIMYFLVGTVARVAQQKKAQSAGA